VTKDFIESSNGHALVRITHKEKASDDFKSIILPAKAAKDGKKNGIQLNCETYTHGGSTVNFQPIDGEFPDTDQVMPKGEPIAKVCLDANLLIQVLKAVKTFRKDSRIAGIEISVYDTQTQVKIRSLSTDQDQELTAIVMPTKGLV